MDESGSHGGFDWEGAEDITALSEEDLREVLGALREEERMVGYRLGVLQGRIDLIRAELVERDAVALPPEDLARVLLGETSYEERA